MERWCNTFLEHLRRNLFSISGRWRMCMYDSIDIRQIGLIKQWITGPISGQKTTHVHEPGQQLIISRSGAFIICLPLSNVSCSWWRQKSHNCLKRVENNFFSFFFLRLPENSFRDSNHLERARRALSLRKVLQISCIFHYLPRAFRNR